MAGQGTIYPDVIESISVKVHLQQSSRIIMLADFPTT